MTKQRLHKVFSITLALLVLASTLSFAIEKHFCGDVLVDVSVFTPADKCSMEALEILQKKTCCKDEVDIIQGQKELKFSGFEDLDFQQQQFVTAFGFSYLNLFESTLEKNIPYNNYSPPNLVTDIQVLDQVFLI